MVDHLNGRDILTLFVELEPGRAADEMEPLIHRVFREKIGLAARCETGRDRRSAAQ